MTTTAAAPAGTASLDSIRSRFPALRRRHAGRPVAYFDGPGGTQVPLSPLKPGKYTFKIKVTDKVANKSIDRTAEFAVE